MPPKKSDQDIADEITYVIKAMNPDQMSVWLKMWIPRLKHLTDQEIKEQLEIVDKFDFTQERFRVAYMNNSWGNMFANNLPLDAAEWLLHKGISVLDNKTLQANFVVETASPSPIRDASAGESMVSVDSPPPRLTSKNLGQARDPTKLDYSSESSNEGTPPQRYTIVLDPVVRHIPTPTRATQAAPVITVEEAPKKVHQQFENVKFEKPNVGQQLRAYNDINAAASEVSGGYRQPQVNSFGQAPYVYGANSMYTHLANQSSHYPRLASNGFQMPASQPLGNPFNTGPVNPYNITGTTHIRQHTPSPDNNAAAAFNPATSTGLPAAPGTALPTMKLPPPAQQQNKTTHKDPKQPPTAAAGGGGGTKPPTTYHETRSKQTTAIKKNMDSFVDELVAKGYNDADAHAYLVKHFETAGATLGKRSGAGISQYDREIVNFKRNHTSTAAGEQFNETQEIAKLQELNRGTTHNLMKDGGYQPNAKIAPDQGNEAKKKTVYVLEKGRLVGNKVTHPNHINMKEKLRQPTMREKLAFLRNKHKSIVRSSDFKVKF